MVIRSYLNLTGLRNATSSVMLEKPQEATAGWSNIGRPLHVHGLNALAFWINVTINDTKNLRFRLMSIPEPESDDLYNIPIQTVEPDIVKIKPEFFELEDDLDQKIMFQTSLGDLVPYAQLQVSSGTLGAIPAVVEDILVSIKTGDV